MQSRLAACGLALLGAILFSAPAEAQRYPLAPNVSQGEHLHPFFEGWFLNEDGTKTFSYGYFNRNTDDLEMYIPRGPDNFIEPAEFDGMQPEHFTVRRERGIFTITVPADWGLEQAVTWTLRNSGGEYPVPGTWRAEAYQMSETMAMGSQAPFMRFEADGEESQGIIEPLWADEIQVDAGEAFEISVWGRDNLAEEAAREPVPVTVTVYTHQGPALANVEAVRPEGDEDVEVEPDNDDGPAAFRRQPDPNEFLIPLDSTDPAVFTVSFDQAGEYLLRVSVDNNTAVDSSPGDQCCWSNGYIPVTVD